MILLQNKKLKPIGTQGEGVAKLINIQK